MGMPESDAQLLERVRRGDAGAMETLVRRHLGAALTVARTCTRDPDDADDVCQDAFLTALGHIEDCRRPDRFRAWLCAIVRNCAHSRHRRAARVRTVPLTDALSADRRFDPLRDLERAEAEAELRSAMASLTRLQRAVVTLHELEGQRHREIARRLSISEGAARVHLWAGRRRMRESLTRVNGASP